MPRKDHYMDSVCFKKQNKKKKNMKLEGRCGSIHEELLEEWWMNVIKIQCMYVCMYVWGSCLLVGRTLVRGRGRFTEACKM